MIRVELYEMARHLAGVAALEVEAATLSEALRATRLAHPALSPSVIEEGGVIAGDHLAPHWRASHNGGAWITDPLTPLAAGDVLVLVSALAGG